MELDWTTNNFMRLMHKGKSIHFLSTVLISDISLLRCGELADTCVETAACDKVLPEQEPSHCAP